MNIKRQIERLNQAHEEQRRIGLAIIEELGLSDLLRTPVAMPRLGRAPSSVSAPGPMAPSATKKGRKRRKRSVITRELFDAVKKSPLSISKAAKEFGVAQATVHRIRAGLTKPKE